MLRGSLSSKIQNSTSAHLTIYSVLRPISLYQTRSHGSQRRVHAQSTEGLGPRVSAPRKFANIVGCIAVLVALLVAMRYSQIPMALDMSLSIFLAEYCLRDNKRRRRLSQVNPRSINPNRLENNTTKKRRPKFIASMVGYREEPELFTRALQSYVNAKSLAFMLVCIDGDSRDDQAMIEVFKKVFPKNSAQIHFDVPLVELALSLESGDPDSKSNSAAITQCCLFVKQQLKVQGIKLQGTDAVTSLCVSQPHMHKKGIMFTSFILSCVLSEALGTDYLWTTDSDSMILPDTLKMTMYAFSEDDTVGGTSTGLTIHNKNETLTTKFASAAFLGQLHLERSFSGAVMANVCQSGPCAAFRISAVKPELLPWYKQKVFGRWMVVNEDRHLSTRLLAKGWKIAYCSDVMTMTETPTTFRRWLVQQARWERATHIDCFYLPGMYMLHSPLLFFSALRREPLAIMLPLPVINYLLPGSSLLPGSFIRDFLLRNAIAIIYLAFRNPCRPSKLELLALIPTGLVLNIVQPAITVWGIATLTDGSWGTSMRSSTEMAKKGQLRERLWQVGFFVAWMGLLGGCVGRSIGASLMVGPVQLAAFVAIGSLPMWGFAYWYLVTE